MSQQKNKYIQMLENLMKHFSQDQNTLNLISLLKGKILELDELEELAKPVSSSDYNLPLPSELNLKEKQYALFSDGACRGNPGPGAWGGLGQNHQGDVIFETSGIDTTTTNNRMELQGAIEVLKQLGQIAREDGLNEGSLEVFLFSDSKYVVEGMKSWVHSWKRRGWKKADNKVPENIELWKELVEFTDLFWKVNYHWVKGHSGHPQNERCDRLANEALDSSGF